MAKIRRASLSLSYNNVDITTDLSNYLVSFSYEDNSDNKADGLKLCWRTKKVYGVAVGIQTKVPG